MSAKSSLKVGYAFKMTSVVHLYQCTGEDCAHLAAAHQQDFTGRMLAGNPDLSLCPEASQSFPGQPGLRRRDAQGAVSKSKLSICFGRRGYTDFSADLQ